MLRVLLYLIASGLVAGCSCSETGIEGRPDSNDDPGVDMVEDDAPVPCPDRDGDGYLDAACGGDDCDDTRPDVHPMAEEVCHDGVDGDCDGIVDGLKQGPMPVFVNDVSYAVYPNYNDPGLVWNGRESVMVFGGCSRTLDMRAPGYLSRIDINGAEIGSDRVLEYTGSAAWDIVRAPRIAWTGSRYGLVWIGPWGDDDLFFSMLDESGAAVADATQVNPADDVSVVLADIVWSGSAFGVTYAERYHDDEVWFALLDPVGTVLSETLLSVPEDGPRVVEYVADHNFYMVGVDSVWTGSNFGAAWMQGEDDGRESTRGLHLARLDGTGTPIPGNTTLLERPMWPNAELAWTGSEFVLAWSAFDVESVVRVFFMTRINPNGEIIVPETFLFNGEYNHMGVRLAWSGSEFALFLGSSGIARFDATGTVIEEIIDPDFIEYPGCASSFVWTDDAFVIAWSDIVSDVGGRVQYTWFSYCE